MAIKELVEGTPVRLDRLTQDSKETQPPKRLSESAAAAALDRLGIGRPSTLSSIISTIQDRGYVVRKGTQLYPTALGFTIARMLRDKLPDFVGYDSTAKMEEKLDEIEEGKLDATKFLRDFWLGKDGLEAELERLKGGGLTLDEIKTYGLIDLYNGYNVRFSRFGTFIEDPNGEPNEKGFLPSAKIDDNADLWEYRDAELCKKLIEESANFVGPRDLGVLESGEYEGWTVRARSGRFGDFLQALHPKHIEAEAAGKKPGKGIPAPVNQKLPEGVELDSITLEEASPLFAEVKLPRWSEDKLWLVGLNKKNKPYMGRKSSPRGRPVFRNLPEGLDPRTVSFSEVKEVWEAYDEEKDSKSASRKRGKK